MRILALLQRRTLIETKNRSLKCLKRHYLTVRSMKKFAALTEDSSRIPTPGNLPSKAKKMLMPGGQPGWGGDWCINVTDHECGIGISLIFDTVFRYLPIFLTVFRCWVPPNVPLKRSIVWKRGAKWRSFVISGFTQTSLGCILEPRGPESEIF